MRIHHGEHVVLLDVWFSRLSLQRCKVSKYHLQQHSPGYEIKHAENVTSTSFPEMGSLYSVTTNFNQKDYWNIAICCVADQNVTIQRPRHR